MRKNNNKLIAFAVTASIIALLYLLTITEQQRPDATIRTPLDAFWYFIATITTVGYGDVSPVSPFGKILGVFFILLSCGFISVLITSTIRFMNGSFILKMKLALSQVDKWYIFNEYNEEADLLARNLWNLKENSGVIFCNAEHRIGGLFRVRFIFTPLSVEETMALCTKKQEKGIGEKPIVFLMDEDEEKNLKTALSLTGMRSLLYCKTGIRFQNPPTGLRTFDPADLTARAYWHDHPLSSREKNVVMIGNGALLNYIIEQAVIVNVFGPFLICRYHVFNEKKTHDPNRHSDDIFLEDHPHIKDVLSVRTVSGEEVVNDEAANDTFFFHTDAWDKNHQYLEMADRIIVCTTSEIENIRIAEKIRSLCATKADLYIYGSDSIDGVTGFGSIAELYTPERILREDMLKRARTLNDYYNSLQQDESKRTRWEDLSMFTKRSNMAAADHMGTKLRILLDCLDENTAIEADRDTIDLAVRNFRENVIDRNLCRQIEHERWMRFHSLYGWTYGEVRDNALRRHPLMVPFEELAPEQQAMDDISWELLEVLRE